MMEILQMLKFLFRSERLDFNDRWVDREEDLTVVDVAPEIIDDMIAKRQISELTNLLLEADKNYNNT